jgi:hypothetical protein
MASKPLPSIPSAQPPQIRGVAQVKTPSTPQPGVPGPEENKENISSADMKPAVVFPETLKNGDILLDVREQPPLHSVRMIQRTDPSQRFPFLMDCKCGSQARVYTKQALEEATQGHLALRSYREVPK